MGDPFNGDSIQFSVLKRNCTLKAKEGLIRFRLHMKNKSLAMTFSKMKGDVGLASFLKTNDKALQLTNHRLLIQASRMHKMKIYQMLLRITISSKRCYNLFVVSRQLVALFDYYLSMLLISTMVNNGNGAERGTG